LHQFHQHLRVFVQKYFEQLFSSQSWALQFFGAKMLAQKVRVNVDEIDTLYKLKVLVFEAKLSVIIG